MPWRQTRSTAAMARRSWPCTPNPPALATACPGIADSPARQTLCEAEDEDAWRTRLPREHGAFWGWLQEQDVPTLLSLMAVCVARATNAGPSTWTTPEGSQCIVAQVAMAAGLDMRTCWTATGDSYLGRMPKALIVDAVRKGACGRADRRQQEADNGRRRRVASGRNRLASFYPARFESELSRGLWRHRRPDHPGNADRCRVALLL